MTSNITLRTLGPIETNMVARLTYEKKTIVTVKDLDILFNLSPENRKQVVFRLKKKKILIPIKRGIYIFSPLESGASGIGIDEFLIPPQYFPKKNYYIGYSTMYNYYGFTEQLFQTVYVLNTSLSKEKKICSFSYKFIKIPENRMYGLEAIKVRDANVIISSRERTLIDLIYFNKPVGGINSAGNIFTNTVRQKKCNIKKLIEYAANFSNVKVRKYIGVTLENLGISEVILKPLIKSIENTAIGAFGASRKGKLNKRWRIIINDS